jgi:hypothetical protein
MHGAQRLAGSTQTLLGTLVLYRSTAIALAAPASWMAGCLAGERATLPRPFRLQVRTRYPILPLAAAPHVPSRLLKNPAYGRSYLVWQLLAKGSMAWGPGCDRLDPARRGSSSMLQADSSCRQQLGDADQAPQGTDHLPIIDHLAVLNSCGRQGRGFQEWRCLTKRPRVPLKPAAPWTANGCMVRR